jgi:YegS/Rv2252/BmrU family lipid kinase
MTRKIVFVVNPISGTANKGKLQQLIQQETEKEGIEYQIVPSVASGNYKHLVPMIEDEGVTDIIACGGDGTISALAGSLQGQQINIGVIPLGSGNGLARTAGIPSNPELALQIIYKGKSLEIDGFTVNGQFACMLSGLGFDAQVAHHFARHTRRGLVTYTQETITQYFKARFYPFEITLPDFCFFSEAFFISIANSNQFGNNVTIAPEASLTDGLLDIVIVQKMSKLRLPFAILRQIRGVNHLQQLADEISKKNIIYFQTPQVQISNRKYAPLHIDGDPKETTDSFNIQVVPKAFRLLVP